jgi:hypothetical protein
MTNRKDLENRITQIISYINKHKKIIPLVWWWLHLFALGELLQLKEFLETWKYSIIHKLMKNKIDEYFQVAEEIKQLKIWWKKEILKNKELQEQKQEEVNIELLLN